jgi:hypothetical protein
MSGIEKCHLTTVLTVFIMEAVNLSYLLKPLEGFDESLSYAHRLRRRSRQ